MAKLFGVDFAPLSIPLERRLQTLVVLVYAAMFTVAPFLCLLFFLILLFTPLFWVAIGYISWIIYDAFLQDTSSHGGRRWDWVRRNTIWTYFRDYFPISLVKTADLDPSKNYLMGYHPHGIIGCGAIGNFASEATGFSEKYPGITPYLMTLKPNFKLPIIRGFLLWMGVVDVSKSSIEWVLTKQGKGRAAVIVIGGAAEALEAKPGNYNIMLKSRKGFVKMAIRSGADLVPIFSFGENDLYRQADNPRGSTLRRFQEGFKHWFGFSPPLFYGRGVFNYTFGLIPFRKPIHTVVGKPIAVEQEREPSNDTINDYHEKYMAELSKLFDEHKTQYGIDIEMTLKFV